jgi:hypothetical protein
MSKSPKCKRKQGNELKKSQSLKQMPNPLEWSRFPFKSDATCSRNVSDENFEFMNSFRPDAWNSFPNVRSDKQILSINNNYQFIKGQSHIKNEFVGLEWYNNCQSVPIPPISNLSFNRDIPLSADGDCNTLDFNWSYDHEHLKVSVPPPPSSTLSTVTVNGNNLNIPHLLLSEIHETLNDFCSHDSNASSCRTSEESISNSSDDESFPAVENEVKSFNNTEMNIDPLHALFGKANQNFILDDFTDPVDTFDDCRPLKRKRSVSTGNLNRKSDSKADSKRRGRPKRSMSQLDTVISENFFDLIAAHQVKVDHVSVNELSPTHVIDNHQTFDILDHDLLDMNIFDNFV